MNVQCPVCEVRLGSLLSGGEHAPECPESDLTLGEFITATFGCATQLAEEAAERLNAALPKNRRIRA